jgi:hypothetical protein
MADIGALFTTAILEQWPILLAIIFGVFAIVPWIGLAVLNVFNKNILAEIRSTFNRALVKIILIKQNGQSAVLYRPMNEDRSITISKEDNGIEQNITPTTAPHPDAQSHKHAYVAIEGQEGTLNLLEKTKYDVNSPQKKMGFSMAFEAGREFEKYNNEPNSGLLSPRNIIIGGGITVVCILVLLMLYSQQEMLNAIAEAVGAKITG